MKELYYCTVTWYNDYDNETKTCHLLTIAGSYGEAVSNAEESFTFVEKVTAEKIVSDTDDIKCIYIDDNPKTLEMIKEYNDY